jgi:hypothetical protein
MDGSFTYTRSKVKSVLVWLLHYTKQTQNKKDLEDEFIQRRMFYLNEACSNLETDPETSLTALKRGLLLLKH